MAEGAFDRSKEGIEIWDRTWDTVKKRLWPEDPAINSGFSRLFHAKQWQNPKYWFYPANSPFNPEYLPETINQGVLLGLKEMFSQQAIIAEPGCGGGAAAIGAGYQFGHAQIYPFDYEWGGKIKTPKNVPQNVHPSNQDWKNTNFPDNSFSGIFSDQGVGVYGNEDAVLQEMTRISRPSAILRATQDKGRFGDMNFSDRLVKFGWDVYILQRQTGGATNIVVAKLANKK